MTDREPTTVLVVEDEEDLAEMYADWLAEDYEVRVAFEGDSALSKMDDAVDVVLLDRLMPGMSGDEVLAELRDGGFDLRVAMITAVEPDFDVLEMGFDDYLVKPVFAEEIRATVERLLARGSYDDRLQRYFALVSKRSALEAYRPPEELGDSEEYTEIAAEIDRLRSELEGMLAEFDDAAFEAVFQSMDRSSTVGR